MSTTALVAEQGPITIAALKNLLGLDVEVETVEGVARARLLSCVRDSAWFVVGDTDVVLPLAALVRVSAAA